MILLTNHAPGIRPVCVWWESRLTIPIRPGLPGNGKLRLESFLLHYRGLKEFLSDTHTKNSDDIKATDFVTGWKASEAGLLIKAKPSAFIRVWRILRQPRGSINGRWNADQMQQHVLVAFDELIRALPTHAKPWFSVIEKAKIGERTKRDRRNREWNPLGFSGNDNVPH